MGFFDDVDIESVKKQSTKTVPQNESAEIEEGETPQDESDMLSDLLNDGLSEEHDDESENVYSSDPIPSAEEAEEKEEKPMKTDEKNDSVKKDTKATKSQTAEKTTTSCSDPKKSPSDKKNVIVEGTALSGDISSEAPIDIYGAVNGSVKSRETVYIGKSGSVSGFVEANGDVYAYGTIGSGIKAGESGDITICDCKIKGPIEGKNIDIQKDAVVIGNVFSIGNTTITGAVKGDIESRSHVNVKNTAIIQGNIKSSTISIEPGAALDGTCTQEYAKVKPADFFADM